MKIYIAGPIGAWEDKRRFGNILNAQEVAIKLIKQGHSVYCPHLSHYLDAQARLYGDVIPDEVWKAQDLPWLEAADALYFIGKSPGANAELEYAKFLGKEIIYHAG